MCINRNMGVTEVRGLGVCYLVALSCGCRDLLCWCKDLVKEREETMKARVVVDTTTTVSGDGREGGGV